MKHTKLLVAGVVVALVLAAFAAYKSLSHDSVLTAGATPGTNYIENYSPAVLYNGGISSQLPIQTTSDITASSFIGTITGGAITGTTLALTGSSTIGTAFNATGATSTLADVKQVSNATTTLKVLSTSSTQGGCIQLNATSTATSVYLKLSPLGATSTFDGTAYWAYGTCE